MKTKTFRIINGRELQLIGNCTSRHQNPPDTDLRFTDAHRLQVSYEFLPAGSHEQEFCIAVVMLADIQGFGLWLWRGVSRKSRNDKHNPIKAKMTSFRRAIMNSQPVFVVPGVRGEIVASGLIQRITGLSSPFADSEREAISDPEKVAELRRLMGGNP